MAHRLGSRGRPRPRLLHPLVALALLVAACGGGSTTASPSGAGGSPGAGAASASPGALSGSITLYTTVTQATVDAVVAGWNAVAPGVRVDVFRAPTAQVAARIAADLARGSVRADVLWLTDPLSMQGYAGQGLLLKWTPAGAAGIKPAYQTDTYVGTRLLNMVLVKGAGVGAEFADWNDLTAAPYRGAAALPDPGFAGSAFAALGYFSAAPGYGLPYFQKLKDNGATQVASPDDVTTGVAEGRFKVGMTLDNLTRAAVAKGSPIQLVWPTSGAIAIYSPIAVVASSTQTDAAKAFEEFTLSAGGQSAIADTGWQPILGPGGPQPGGPEVSPDWTTLYGSQQALLDSYRAIFGQ